MSGFLSNQRQLFLAGPGFYFRFSLASFSEGVVFLLVFQSDGSTDLCIVCAGFGVIVLFESAHKIIGRANVESAVNAFENVDIKSHFSIIHRRP